MPAAASNAPCVVNIEIQRGDTWSLQFVARRPNGTIVNLTNYAIAAQLRHKKKSADDAIEFVCTIDDAAAGLFSLHLTPAVTAALDCGESRYDVASQYVWGNELTSPSGHTYTTHQGAAVVLADVSRSA